MSNLAKTMSISSTKPQADDDMSLAGKPPPKLQPSSKGGGSGAALRGAKSGPAAATTATGVDAAGNGKIEEGPDAKGTDVAGRDVNGADAIVSAGNGIIRNDAAIGDSGVSNAQPPAADVPTAKGGAATAGNISTDLMTGRAAPAHGGTAEPGEVQPGDKTEVSTERGWFAQVREKLGLAGPQTLRDSLEETLKAAPETDADVTPAERDMLLRQLRFGSLRVDDIMVPRADIISIDENQTLGELLATFEEAGASRIPLYHETLDDPRGMVHIKDLFALMMMSARNNGGQAGKKVNGTKEQQINLGAVDLSKKISSTKLRRPILYVPPSMPAMNLLIRMQSTHIHMALVVDEYGGTDGLATIEDLIEQVVGEIEDEHDDEAQAHIKTDPQLGLVADARMPIEELESYLGVKLLSVEEEEDIDTLGGLVFSLVSRVPARGEIVHHPAGIEFEVLDADPRRIKRLKLDLSKLEQVRDEEAEA